MSSSSKENAAFAGQSLSSFTKTQEALRNCGKLLTFLITHKDSSPFIEPVNWKEWGLLDYPKIIKTPMDLNLVKVSSLYTISTGCSDKKQRWIMYLLCICFLVWHSYLTSLSFLHSSPVIFLPPAPRNSLRISENLRRTSMPFLKSLSTMWT